MYRVCFLGIPINAALSIENTNSQKAWNIIIGASLSEPHTDRENGPRVGDNGWLAGYL